MKDDPIPNKEETPASSVTPEAPEQSGGETAERVASFSRRALIEAGWTVPVILSVVLPERVLAQSGGGGNFLHVDHHADLLVIEHSDSPFTDDTAHNDNPHADRPFGDIHTDMASGPFQLIHADIAHGDQFFDSAFADGGFADHADAGPQHTDNAHVDTHSDVTFSRPPVHADFHADFPHLDFAINVHSDHTDGKPNNPGGGGAFTDHTDGSCRTTHGDNSHADENTHVDHYDVTPNAQLHLDHCDTPTGHADSGVGHQDVHADRHADIRHSDVHLDFGTPGITSRGRQP